MANIAHSIISDPDRHEPKGISSAPAGSVYVSGSGDSGTWTPAEFPVATTNILSARSFVDQNPTGTDTALQVTFGAEQTTTDVSLSSAGAFTINTAGTYRIEFVLRFNRTSAAGDTLMGVRWLVNGTTQGSPTAIRLGDGSYTIPFSYTALVDFNAGDVITVEIIRDSSGVDNGGIETVGFVNTDWSDAASAVAVIDKLEAGL